jgi:hypothetical protein
MDDDKQTDSDLCQQLQCLADENFPIGSAVIDETIDRLEQYRNEVTSVLELLDGLAGQWGDEAVLRISRELQQLPDAGSTAIAASECITNQSKAILTCRDRLRELVK